MKLDFNRKYTTIAVYAGLVALFCVICVVIGINIGGVAGFFVSILNVLKPLIYAFVIAFMMYPAAKFLERFAFGFIGRKNPEKQSEKRARIYRKLRRGLSISLAYILLTATIVTAVLIYIPKLTVSYDELISRFTGYLTYLSDWIGSLKNGDGLIAGIITQNYDDISQLLSTLGTNVYSYLSQLAPQLIKTAGSAVNETKNILLGLIFSVYFVIDNDRLRAQIKKTICAFFDERAYLGILELGRLTQRTFREFIIGKLIDSLFIGLLCATLMAVLGLPYAPIVSLLLGIFSFVPYVGVLLGAVPGFFIILIAAPTKLLWYLLMILALVLLNGNVIEPRILSGNTGLTALWVLVAIIFMGGLFGAVGLVIGVPVFNILYLIVKGAAESKLKRRGLPSDTASYYSDAPK